MAIRVQENQGHMGRRLRTALRVRGGDVMLGFALLLLFLLTMQKIPIGKAEVYKIDPYDNGSKEKFMLNRNYEFLTLDDAMEYRELRQSGWKGDARDFYLWKYDDIMDDIVL